MNNGVLMDTIDKRLENLSDEVNLTCEKNGSNIR